MYKLNEDKMLFKSQEVHSDGGQSFYNHLYNSDGSDIDQQYNTSPVIDHHEESDIGHQYESGSSIDHQFDEDTNEVYHRSDLEGIYEHLNSNDGSSDVGQEAVYQRSVLPDHNEHSYHSSSASSSDRNYENHIVSSQFSGGQTNYNHHSSSSPYSSNDQEDPSLSSYTDHEHEVEEGHEYLSGQTYHSKSSSQYPDNHINSNHRDQFMAKPDVYQYYDFDSSPHEALKKNPYPGTKKSYEDKPVYIPI